MKQKDRLLDRTKMSQISCRKANTLYVYRNELYIECKHVERRLKWYFGVDDHSGAVATVL